MIGQRQHQRTNPHGPSLDERIKIKPQHPMVSTHVEERGRLDHEGNMQGGREIEWEKGKERQDGYVDMMRHCDGLWIARY